jgi:phosphoglycolate phosphatase
MCGKYHIPLTKEDENFLLYTTADSFLRKNAPDMTADQRAKFGKELSQREIAAVKAHGRLFDGVYDMLITLARDDIEMAICGMGSKEYIEAALDHCGVARYFKAVYHRVEGLTKAQVMKIMLADMSAASDPCFMVGDSVNDLIAARENGIPFIGVRYGYGADDISDADMLVDNAMQLQTAIYKFLIYSRIECDVYALRKPAVIGINGVDTSGKTTLASELVTYLTHRGIHTIFISADDFHNTRAVRSADSSPEAYIKYAFNTSKMFTVIRDLKQNPQKMTVDLLDLDTDAYTNQKVFDVTDDTVIIVEGVMLFRSPLNELFDYRIFLDITFDEVLNRARERDVPKYGDAFLQRYIDRYIPAQKLYLNEYNPKENSQLVIDNNDFLKPVIR